MMMSSSSSSSSTVVTKHASAFVFGVVLAVIVGSLSFLLLGAQTSYQTALGQQTQKALTQQTTRHKPKATMKQKRRKAQPASPTPAAVANSGEEEEEEEKEVTPPAPASGQVVRRPNNFMADLNTWVVGEWKGDEYIPKYLTRCETGLWENPTGNKYYRTKLRYKMFKAEEAQACLQNNRVVIIGDSYMRGMFIGLVDVVKGNLTHESRHVRTSKALSKMTYDYNLEDLKSDTFRVGHVTQQNYFVDKSHTPLGTRLKANDEVILKYDYVVINSLIHEVKFRVVQQLKLSDTKLLQLLVSKIIEYIKYVQAKKPSIKFVWVTGTGYRLDLVPRGYREHQTNRRMLWFNTGIVKALHRIGIPFLDIFHMTELCKDLRCFDGHQDKSMKTIDGSHKSRFVNRMKAQMLMNYLCPPQVDETYSTNPLPARGAEMRRIDTNHKFDYERKVNGYKRFAIPKA